MGMIFGGGWSAPAVQAIGANLTNTGGTLAATGGGGSGTVTSVTTSGAGITATPDPITNAGTVTVEWNAGSVGAIGSGLTLTTGTLTAGGGGGGSVTVNGQGGVGASGATLNLDTVPFGFTPFTTWLNQGNASFAAETNGPLIVQNQTITANAVNLRYKTLSLASAFTLTAQMRLNGSINNNAPAVGIGLTDGTKLITFENANGKGAFNQYAVQEWTNSTTYDTNLAVLELTPSADFWLRIAFNGTATWTFSVSLDGFVWIPIYTTSSLPITPIGVGVNISGYNTTGTLAGVLTLNYWNGA